MSAKYNLASNTTSGDRFLYVGQSSVHLSTGDCVQLVTDPSQSNPNKVSLVLATGAARGTTSTISTIGAITTGTGAFAIDYALPQCLALCRDASDNLYVIGASGSASTTLIRYQAFIKQTGLVWQPAVANVCITPASTTLPPVGYVAVWCNTGGGGTYPTGGGGGPAGHIFVAATTNDHGVTNACYILSAAPILAGATQSGTVVVNPAFIADSATLYGSNLDISTQGFGTTSGLCISASGTTTALVSSWGVTSTGQLTTGVGAFTSFGTATLTTATKLRVAYNQGLGYFVCAFPSASNAGQVTVLSPLFSLGTQLSVDTGTASNFPAPSATLSWDLSTDPDGTTWIYGWSSGTSTTMLRVPITFPAGVPTLGATVSDDTSVGGTNTTIRCVKEPVDWFHADWQTYSHVSTTYSLQGDYSVLLVAPYEPVLVSPANNAAAPLASGGTFTWAFSSPEASDAQVTYYLRFQTSSGYQWWNGSALTSAQSGATGGNEVAVTSATNSATLGSSILSTGAWSWSVQVTGSAGVVSGYSPAWVVNVVAQPATPTLTASYDATNNRATLVVAGTGAYDAWFEYSDDGTDWYNVRGATAVTQSSGAATVYDWEIAANATRSYRVLQWNPAATVMFNYSAWSTTQTATSSISLFWLRDPLLTDIGINPHVLTGTLNHSTGENLTEHNPLGNPATVIVADVIGLEDGGCTFYTKNTTDDTNLNALLNSQDVQLFQSPDGGNWYVRWNAARPKNKPYLVTTGGYREYAMAWRGQPRPAA
jgi:hypothetical protein